MLEILKEKGDRLDKMLFELKWPPPGHLSAVLLDKISLSFERGKITAQEVDAILVHFYNKDKLHSMLDSWSEQVFIRPRIKILKEVVTAHIEGRFELSIPALLPQIEGIIADIKEHAGRMNFKDVKKYAEALFSGNTRFNQVGKVFFISILYENFEWQDPIPFFSRNAILHGADTNYASAANSLRLILIFDQLQSSVKTPDTW
jgi:hypothetical protein